MKQEVTREALSLAREMREQDRMAYELADRGVFNVADVTGHNPNLFSPGLPAHIQPPFERGR